MIEIDTHNTHIYIYGLINIDHTKQTANYHHLRDGLFVGLRPSERRGEWPRVPRGGVAIGTEGGTRGFGWGAGSLHPASPGECICIYVYMCVSVCVYICVYIYMYAHMYIYIYIYIYVYVNIYMHTHTYIYTYIYIHV